VTECIFTYIRKISGCNLAWFDPMTDHPADCDLHGLVKVANLMTMIQTTSFKNISSVSGKRIFI